MPLKQLSAWTCGRLILVPSAERTAGKRANSSNFSKVDLNKGRSGCGSAITIPTIREGRPAERRVIELDFPII